MTAHWWIFKNYTVCGTSSAFAVVLLALEVLAMYLFQTITLTIMNRALNFLGLIVFFALKLSRKVKACSLAENRPGDILLQLKTNNKFSSGDCDMLVSSPLLNTLYFYFRHFLSTYWLISPGGGGGGTHI